MRVEAVDAYSYLKSPIHQASTSLKLAAALVIIVSLAATPGFHAWLHAGIAVALLSALWVSKIPPWFLLRRLLLLEPLVLGVAGLALLQPHGVTLMASMVVRSTLSLATMLLLTNTTPFTELLRLLRRLGIPELLVTTLLLMVRYLFVLVDETDRMQRARRCRTFATGHRRTWRSYATLLGQLFVRSSERAQRIYAAMCARGWQ